LRQEPLYPTPRIRASERHSVEADLSAAWEKPSFLPSSQPRSIWGNSAVAASLCQGTFGGGSSKIQHQASSRAFAKAIN
jgi:hypothetical protein